MTKLGTVTSDTDTRHMAIVVFEVRLKVHDLRESLGCAHMIPLAPQARAANAIHSSNLCASPLTPQSR